SVSRRKRPASGSTASWTASWNLCPRPESDTEGFRNTYMSRKRQINTQLDQFRTRGAFLTLEQLLEQRHAARSLELDYQHRSRLGMSGAHLSKTKGRGVDFEEHRAYQPGDDIRAIDWRVTARTGRPFIKVFREERERPVIIGVDQSHNMFFGSHVAFKSVV